MTVGSERVSSLGGLDGPPEERETVVSYSQNAEDVRLWRIFGAVQNGFYVDVGAGHPSHASVTRLFYDHGWSGINVEPSPAFDALSEARTRDVNLRVAIGEVEREVPFFLTYPDVGMSTLDPASYAHAADFVERIEEVAVPQRRLASILREHAGGRTIHFLKVDVEGAERAVLASCDWGSFRPIVVVVEAVRAWDATQTHEAWEHILTGAAYHFAAFDGVNRFYLEDGYRELIPTLAYPVCALDRFVPASVHEHHVGDSRTRELEEELERTRAALAEAKREAARLAAELDRLRRSESELLDAVYRSRTWRAGKLVASVGAPALAVARSLGVRRMRTQRALPPKQAYAEAVRKGRPWHFARTRRIGVRRGATPLDRLARAFGSPDVALDAGRAARLAEELERSGWADEESLLAGRLSWFERRAALEAEAVARLALGSGRGSARGRGRERVSAADSVVVVDARCLQDPAYRSRGVGLHARTVLAAARAAAAREPLVLLTAADLPDLDDEVARAADDVVHTRYELRDASVSLFLQLSPMTASAAPAVPFLAGGARAAASVVYDFIPTAFPSAYLRSATAALWNRVRIEALRHYDLLLPISGSTANACRRILGSHVQASVTGVADPLEAVAPASVATRRPFVLVPAGGDARKNVAAAVAAVARYREAGRGALRAVVTGALIDAQGAALDALARRLGLPADAVELSGPVSDAELLALYQAAEFVVVPSFAEGFSIPVAEAVLRGTPVVASDIPVHRELLGAGPWLARPDDIDALADALSYVRRERDAVAARQREALGDHATPAAVTGRLTQALASLLEEPRVDRRVPPATRTRPRLALVSPFPPQRSGVADYTEFTFRQVARYADVEVYTGAPADSSSPFAVHRVDSAPYVNGAFDAVVNVVANNHFHFPILDLMESFGGACIAHDNRMIDAYRSDRGDAWTAELLSTPTRTVSPHELDALSVDLDRAPSLGYELIARQAKPLIVHGRALSERIERETGARPVVVPFVPYNVPEGAITDAARARARSALGLADDIVHIASFGIVDRRTKGTDVVVAAAGLLRSRGVRVRVQIVGDAPPEERLALELFAEEVGISEETTLHGRVDRPLLEQFLLGVDVAVQLRTSGVLSLSGALADCIAFGVPTVTTEDLATEFEAPSYVAPVASPASSELVADAIEALRDRRREHATIEAERLEYLSRRSVDAYAQGLLAALGLAVR